MDKKLIINIYIPNYVFPDFLNRIKLYGDKHHVEVSGDIKTNEFVFGEFRFRLNGSLDPNNYCAVLVLKDISEVWNLLENEVKRLKG